MQSTTLILTGRLLAAALACTLATTPVLADKPEWAGGGKHGSRHQGRDDDHGRGGSHGKHGDERREPRVGAYFVDRDRVAVQGYYQHEYGGGRKHCPPGLAKKNNGCLPPGQARKAWVVGQPLPANVVYYPVPQPVLVTLPPPPPRHRYVRIAGDILLIAVGTSLVVDALSDITR